MYEKTIGSSVGPAKFDTTCVVANFDTTREHDTGFCGFRLSIICVDPCNPFSMFVCPPCMKKQ